MKRHAAALIVVVALLIDVLSFFELLPRRIGLLNQGIVRSGDWLPFAEYADYFYVVLFTLMVVFGVVRLLMRGNALFQAVKQDWNVKDPGVGDGMAFLCLAWMPQILAFMLLHVAQPFGFGAGYIILVVGFALHLYMAVQVFLTK